jgi:hypothetical protein
MAISKPFTPVAQAAMITVKELSTGAIVTIPVSYYYANLSKYSLIDTSQVPPGTTINPATGTVSVGAQPIAEASILPFGIDENTAFLIIAIVVIWHFFK